MGIPLYYKNIINNYPEIIDKSSEFKTDINNLLFDLNCAIHPCCRGVTDELVMMKNVVDKIKECIDITNVQKKVYTNKIN